MLNGVCG